jgi:hypothetical protein
MRNLNELIIADALTEADYYPKVGRCLLMDLKPLGRINRLVGNLMIRSEVGFCPALVPGLSKGRPTRLIGRFRTRAKKVDPAVFQPSCRG